MVLETKRLLVALALGASLAHTPGPLRGQEQTDSVRVELARMRARIDSLEAMVRRLEQAGRPAEAGDALAELRRAAEAAGREGAPVDTAGARTPATFTGRQRSLQALNPEISANVDVFGHLNTDDANEHNFVPREFEFSFQASLDPYSRARIFVAHHAAGPELIPFEEGDGHGHEEGAEGGFEVEEGYVEWVGLPGGLGLKLGKFNQRFGTLNRWHAHALPFQSHSLPHIAFMGEESLAQTGASVGWLVPVHGLGTYELTGELTQSSNAPLFGEATDLSFLGHLNAFYELGRSTDLDLGVSWLRGDFEEEGVELAERNLYGVEGSFTWRPPERALYRGFVLRGGAMLLDGLVPHEEEPEEEEEEEDRALGVWSAAELRLSQRWLVGARLDWTENPEDPHETAWLFSPTLTWWQSEWVRLRLEYDLLGRNFPDDDEGRLWLQVTFAMGPHKHETY